MLDAWMAFVPNGGMKKVDSLALKQKPVLCTYVTVVLAIIKASVTAANGFGYGLVGVHADLEKGQAWLSLAADPLVLKLEFQLRRPTKMRSKRLAVYGHR